MEDEIIYDIYNLYDCDMDEGWQEMEGGMPLEGCVQWMRAECGYPVKKQTIGNTWYFFFDDDFKSCIMLVPTNL